MIIEPERRTELIKQKLHYQEVLSKDANSPVFLRLAVVLLQLGDDKEAVQALERGLARHPRYADPHILYAHICIDKSDFLVAESHLKIALEIDPYSTEARLEMAHLLEVSERPKEAIAIYERILNEDAENNPARKALARIRSHTLEKEYEQIGTGKTAERKVMPSGEERRVTVPETSAGEVPEKKLTAPGFPQEGKEDFATLPLAEIYLTQGHLEKARATARKILFENPANSHAQELLQKVEAQIAEQELPEGSLTLELIRDYSNGAPLEMVYEEMELILHQKMYREKARAFGTQVHPASTAVEGELPDIEEIKQRLELDFSSPARPPEGFEEVVEMDMDGLLLGDVIPESEKDVGKNSSRREGTEILQIDGFIMDKGSGGRSSEETDSFERITYPKDVTPPQRSGEVRLPETGRMLELPQEDNEDIETFQQWLDRLTHE